MTDGRVPKQGGFVGLARSRFGFGVAVAGIAGGMKEAPGGRAASSREGGIRLYVPSGIPREGGWKPCEVMERVDSKVLPEKVVPETRAAIGRDSERLELEEF